MPRLDLALILSLLATPLNAGPLPDMAGAWSGSGTARETAESPEESIRCRLDNEWQADRNRLRVKGRCAVPGRTFDIDGALMTTEDGKLSGFWRDPESPGQTSISGQSKDGTAYFSFRAMDLQTGRDISQVISLGVEAGQLRLVSRSRASETKIVDILFEN